MKTFSRIFTLLAFAALLSACITDNSKLGGDALPSLTVDAQTQGKMPVKNFYFEETCVITPDIQYTGTDNLTYTWSIGTYTNGAKGALKEVSHERTLNYKFEQGGRYYAHLTVSDGSVGTVREYEIHIRRPYEEGYLLVSNDASGVGNLAFVNILTPEEIASGLKEIKKEHIIELANPGVVPGRLVGALHSMTTVPVIGEGGQTVAKDINRIIVSTPDRCYFFDPNTFTITTSLEYGQVHPGFQASSFYADSFYPTAYDATSRKSVSLNLQYMYPFEYEYYKNLNSDDVFSEQYKRGTNTDMMNLYANYQTSVVSGFNGNTATFVTTGSQLSGEDILSVFIGAPESNVCKIYVLTKSKTNANQCLVHTYAGIDKLSNTRASKKTYSVTADTAIPQQGTHMAFSSQNNRYFYALGSKVYVFLRDSSTPMPNLGQWAIDFGATETVTTLKMNIDTDQLYIATENTTTHRGNLYIYNASDIKTDNQGKIQPTSIHLDCADRISHIIYKPSL